MIQVACAIDALRDELDGGRKAGRVISNKTRQARALRLLKWLTENGRTISIKEMNGMFEVTVFPRSEVHQHFEGRTLEIAIERASKRFPL